VHIPEETQCGIRYHLYSTPDETWKFTDAGYTGDVASVTLPADNDTYRLVTSVLLCTRLGAY